ncbi:pre-B-cell leukemia transcription factor-interacting protein 1 [Gastrophryne carolinensis]
MAEGSDHRDTENNWVIPNAESLLVETVGAGPGESAPGHEDVTPEVPEPTAPPEGPDAEALLQQEVKGPEPPTLITEVPPHQEELEIPPEEPEPQPGLRRRVACYIEKLVRAIPDPLALGGLRTWGRRSASVTGAELEEVSCSSSEDDAEGLRKRTARGSSPPASVGAAAREAELLEADAGSSLILNKCVIAAIALVGLAVLVFTGGFGGDGDSLQSIIARSVTGEDQQPQAIADIQDWIQEHADQFTGDPDSLQLMSGLLDKVAKENQEIRHMQATLQAQKEELEALLHAGNGGGTPETRVTEENVRLKDALLREETGHLSAKEELQNLQEKLDALEADTPEKETLVSENSQLKTEMETAKRQMESFLTQKETLVAESQMLRQELDKQRLLVASIKQDLEGLTANKTAEEDEKALHNRISEMSKRLAMEAQRSESWEKKYEEHAQKRKEQVGEGKKVHDHKKGDKWVKAEGQVKKPHHKHARDHERRWEEEEPRESQHEEWKSKKHEDKQQWRDKKQRPWEDKVKEPRLKDHETSEKIQKDKRSHHDHRDVGSDFHPRKGQKEFSESHKQGDKAHRHHDHNKFWKKLSDHQYRVPSGCSGLEDCARKDGVDLFNAELKPVERKRFEDLLQSYLVKSGLSKNLPDLVPLLDGFFEGPHFAHHRIRFKDFVDDVEDFLEDLARKETGSEDAADDFERFVYAGFFGDAAQKKRSSKKDDDQRRRDRPDRLQQNPEKTSDSNQTNPRPKHEHDFRVDTEKSNYKDQDKRERQHSEDGKDHRWKKEKRYNGHDRPNQNNNNNSHERDAGEITKYTERDHDHGYKSHHEHEDGDKSYKKHGGNQEWRGDHYHKERYDAEGKHTGHGKDRAEHKYSPSVAEREEEYRHERRDQQEKHEKDEHNRGSRPQDDEGHEGHKKHSQGYKKMESYGRANQRYHSDDQHYDDRSKHSHDNEGDNEHKPYYDKQEGKRPKHRHDNEGDNEHKPYYDYDKQEGKRPKHHHDNEGENELKPHNDYDKQEGKRPKHHHSKEGDNKHKPYYDKQEGRRPKHGHDKQGGNEHKPYYDYKKQEGKRPKHHHDKEGDNKHKPYYDYDKQEGRRPKHHHDKEGDNEHKPDYDYDEQEGRRPKHHHHKQDGSKNKPYHDHYRPKNDHNKPDDHRYDYDQQEGDRPKHHHEKQGGSRNDKPYYDQHDDDRPKNYNKQEDNSYKHHHDKREDYKPKPYYKDQDGYSHKHHHGQHEDKPYYNKRDDYEHKDQRDKYKESKHKSYKSRQGRDEDEDQQGVENHHGSRYKQGHHGDHKKY